MCRTHSTGTAHNKAAVTHVLTQWRQALCTATASSSASNCTCRAFICTAFSAKHADLYLLQCTSLHLAVNYGRVRMRTSQHLEHKSQEPQDKSPPTRTGGRPPTAAMLRSTSSARGVLLERACIGACSPRPHGGVRWHIQDPVRPFVCTTRI